MGRWLVKLQRASLCADGGNVYSLLHPVCIRVDLAFSSACIYSKEFRDAGLGSALVLD